MDNQILNPQDGKPLSFGLVIVTLGDHYRQVYSLNKDGRPDIQIEMPSNCRMEYLNRNQECVLDGRFRRKENKFVLSGRFRKYLGMKEIDLG